MTILFSPKSSIGYLCPLCFSKRYKIRYPSHEDNGPDTPQRATAEIRIQSREPNDIYKIVEAAYEWCGGSVAGIQRELRKHNLSFSRLRISKMLDALNLGRVKRTK